LDGVGNRGAALQAVVTVDNVPPALAAAQERVQLGLGEQGVVLRGTVTDGGPAPRVLVRVQAPDGSQTRQNAARDGGRYWVELDGELPGRYTLWLEAVDAAGNTTTSGPYAVDVTCVDARLETTLTAALAGEGEVYTVSATIASWGPDPLPAGVPVMLYAGDTPVGPAQTLPALDRGQSFLVEALWTSPDGGRHVLSAVVDGSETPASTTLCSTPPMGKTTVGAGPVDQLTPRAWLPWIAR
jgi:hypothetical protein